MIENNKIESAQKPENGANSKNNTSSGYAHPNNKKRYSAEDYENSHLTDNEIDYNYEFARMTAHGRARQKRDDENAERMTNYISRGNFLTNDEMFDVGKYILVYGFGILVGLALGRLLNVGAIGYFIFSAIGMFVVGFIKFNGIDVYSPAQAVKKNLLAMLLAAVIGGAAYLISALRN